MRGESANKPGVRERIANNSKSLNESLKLTRESRRGNPGTNFQIPQDAVECGFFVENDADRATSGISGYHRGSSRHLHEQGAISMPHLDPNDPIPLRDVPRLRCVPGRRPG